MTNGVSSGLISTTITENMGQHRAGKSIISLDYTMNIDVKLSCYLYFSCYERFIYFIFHFQFISSHQWPGGHERGGQREGEDVLFISDSDPR